MSDQTPASPPENAADSGVVSRELFGLLENTAYNLWMAALRISHWPAGQAMYDRMKRPRVGDWVMELSSWRLIKGDRRGCGVLVSVDGDLDSCATKWLIRLPDGATVEWSNAKFIAIPAELHDWYPRQPDSPNAAHEARRDG